MNRLCLNCEANLDSETGLTGKPKPEPGDATICLYCQAILIFTETGFRFPRPEEYADLDDVVQIRDKIRALLQKGIL